MVAFLRYDEEKYFRDPSNIQTERRFPSIFDEEPTKTCSIVIPAKDEEFRLPPMLDECLSFLDKKTQKDPKFTFEVIVVDDGSTDNTFDVAMAYSKIHGVDKLRVLKLKHNRGKGGAVRLGVWVARGRYILFADADGATRFSDFDKLLSMMDCTLSDNSSPGTVSSGMISERDRIPKETSGTLSSTPSKRNQVSTPKIETGSAMSKRPRSGPDSSDDPLRTEANFRSLKDEELLSGDLAVVVGSRAHLEKESVATRSFARTVLMYGFHFLVWLFCVRTVKDTQCGFKMFTRRAALVLFSNMHIERWAFDVELLFVAESLGIPIREVAVTWHEIEGSKLTPLAASVQMARDLFLIWFRYYFGIWVISAPDKDSD